jgi:hypothetical protein
MYLQAFFVLCGLPLKPIYRPSAADLLADGDDDALPADRGAEADSGNDMLRALDR